MILSPGKEEKGTGEAPVPLSAPDVVRTFAPGSRPGGLELFAAGTFTVPAMIFAFSWFIFATSAAGTLGLILPTPTPLLFMSKSRCYHP